eukprot:COSAG04_NODE_8774_length_932_cov_1.705882_2_plen_139_part_00
MRAAPAGRPAPPAPSAAMEARRCGSSESLLAAVREALSGEEKGKVAGVNRALNAFSFEPDAWRRFIHFSQSKYTRNLVVYEKQFSVLLLCWARCVRPPTPAPRPRAQSTPPTARSQRCRPLPVAGARRRPSTTMATSV